MQYTLTNKINLEKIQMQKKIKAATTQIKTPKNVLIF